MNSSELTDDDKAGRTKAEADRSHALSHVQSPPENASVAEADALVGQVVMNNYRVIGVVGRSNVAVVYQAKRSDGKSFALKSPIFPQPWMVSVFTLNAEKAAQLDHPNIVRTFACHKTHDGRPFQIMELVSAVTLQELLESQEFVELEDEIFDFLIQITTAIKYAHSMGIVHGRLLPANILLSESDGVLTVKLIDFGIDETHRALEQEQGLPLRQPCSKKTDIYQLGILAHYICTGKSPVEGKSVDEAMLNPPSNEKLQLLSYTRNDLYCVDELSHLIEEATDPDEEWRLESIELFEESLRLWMDHAIRARTKTSELADEIAASAAAAPPIFKKPGTVSREIKTTIRTIVKLRKSESSQEETLMMQFANKARAGPRRSPLATAARLTAAVLLTIGLIGSVTYALTSHNESLRRIWYDTSNSLSSLVFHRTARDKNDPNEDEVVAQLEREKVAFDGPSNHGSANAGKAGTIPAPQGMSTPERPVPPQFTPEQIHEFYKGTTISTSNNRQKRHFRVGYREFNQDWLK